MTLDVKESVFFAEKNGDGQITSLVLRMTNRPGLCEAMKGGNFLGNLTYFHVVLAQFLDGSPVPTAGDFAVTDGSSGPSKYADITIGQLDANCQPTMSRGGSGGKITVNQYQAEANGTMAGTFDATFGLASERGTGDFNADFCDASFRVSGCQ